MLKALACNSPILITASVVVRVYFLLDYSFYIFYILYFSCTNSISTTILPISAHANQNCFGVLKSKRIALCFVLWFFILLCPSLSFLPSLVLGSSKEKTTIRTTSLWKIVHTRYNIPSQPMSIPNFCLVCLLFFLLYLVPLPWNFFLSPTFTVFALCFVLWIRNLRILTSHMPCNELLTSHCSRGKKGIQNVKRKS